jgi:hypothetical protein
MEAAGCALASPPNTVIPESRQVYPGSIDLGDRPIPAFRFATAGMTKTSLQFMTLLPVA